MYKGNRLNVKNEINVTPFIDVVLVLLIVFMITSPMLVTGFDVDLPKTSAGNTNSENNNLTITMDKLGDLYIEKKKIKLEDLKNQLNALANNNVKVYLRADRALDYGHVMQVFSSIKDAEISNVALVTQEQ